jgi:aryl-alcohol dehydrogenase-like predicted oxidoreductase
MEKIETLQQFYKRKFAAPAQVALSWLLAQKPFIVPIPSTTKLVHLQENLWSADYEFSADELKQLTADVSKIKIIGDRYTRAQAEQTKNKVYHSRLVHTYAGFFV